MTIDEIMTKTPNNDRGSEKTDWEKNATKLRSKRRDLRPQSPVSPIKHRPKTPSI